MLIFMIKFMDLQFVSPEEVIIRQGEKLNENDKMYFLERGGCDVKIRDK